MVAKRSFNFHDGEEDGSRLGVLVPGTKKFKFKNTVLDVMKGLSLNEMVLRMEPFLRKVVREELDRAVQSKRHLSTRSPLNQIEAARGRGLQLQFVNKLPSTIFTGSRIEAEDGTPIRIILYDAASNTTVSSGPLSSIKIEIVVLDGDFGTDNQQDWTEREFNDRILREREGKRPLVTGELNITLKDGIGSIGDVNFTDNSSWIRSRKFRLGARMVQRTAGEVIIREARSEAFVVKDHRGELYKKHYPPSSGDEVWRLERIAKDGAFHKRLTAQGIQNVKDFLRFLEINPTELRNILGGGISTRIWEGIIDHARTCVLDEDELYAYCGAQRVVLLFNATYKLVAAMFDGQNYLPLDKLSLSQKLLVEDVKRQAYKCIDQFIPINQHTVMGPSRVLASPPAEQFSNPNLSLQQLDFPIANQDQPPQLTFNQSPISPSYTYGAECSHQVQVSLPQNSHLMQAFSPTLRNSFTMGNFFPVPYNEETDSPENSLQASIVPANHSMTDDDISHVQMPNWSPGTITWGLGNESTVFPSCPANFVSPKAGWWKIWAVIKICSIRRDVAKRWQYYSLPNDSI